MNGSPDSLVARAAQMTVGEALRDQAALYPDRIAIEDGARRWTYAQFNARVNRLADALAKADVGHGDRIAVLAENCIEYMEVTYAAAKRGAIVCALNWRLAAGELTHCVNLVTPKRAFVSERFAAELAAIETGIADTVVFGDAYEDMLANGDPTEPGCLASPENGLVVIYTSGTTGLPKGALISHRAELARMQSSCIDFGLRPGDCFVAWAPMFHMASMDQSISVLSLGGKVVVIDGFDVERMVDAVTTDPQWWLILMPGMIEPFAEAFRKRNAQPQPITLRLWES